MEDGLVHGDVAAYATGKASLNPCCNGRWSRTCAQSPPIFFQGCLNPCCNGRWSRTCRTATLYANREVVLILVVMEDGLVLDLIRPY